MNRKDVREFLKKRSTIWTLSLCMTGAIVLGGITSMDQARRKAELTETESEPGAQAQLDVNDTLGSSLDEEEAESDPVAAVAGNEVTEEKMTEAESEKAEEASAEVQPETVNDAGHFQRSAGTERDCICSRRGAAALAGCRDFTDGLQHGRKCVFCHLESVQV